MRKSLLILIMLVMACLSSSAVPQTNPSVTVTPSDTLVIDSTANTTSVSFTNEELNSNLMRESDLLEATPSWFDKFLVWNRDHLFLAGLLYNVLAVLLLWIIYRVINLFI